MPAFVSKPSLNQQKPAKRKKTRIPPPQRERIVQKYALGKSIVAISSEEKRNRETVSRIVHGPEVAEFVQAMRERFYGLGCDAIDAIQHALREQKDGRLGIQLLNSIGVVPSSEERQLLTMSQAAAENTERDNINQIMARLIEGAIARDRAYGNRSTDLEDVLRKAGGKIDSAGKIRPLAEND